MQQRTLLIACALLISASAPLQAAITLSGVTLAQTGGTFDINNLAAGATAFAPDIENMNVAGPPQPVGHGGVHTTTGVNNLAYGNTGAWLAGSANSFVGLNLNGSYTVSSIAYGRDNNGGFGDRQLGLVTLQYTTAAAPTYTTPAGNWITIGTMNYTGGNPDFGNADRHRFNFAPVTATGLRLITAASGRGIDEFEVYSSMLSTNLAGGASIIQDETTNASGLPFQGNPIPAEPAPGDGQYHHTNTNTSSFTWSPNITGTNVKVEASWGVSLNHTKDADYFFDPDGSGPMAEIAILQNVDQTLLADGSSSGSVVWSGFRTIAQNLDLTPLSTFRVTGSPAVGGIEPQALTSGVWRFTAVVPEPATIAVWSVLGLVGLAFTGYRCRCAR